MEEYDPCLSLSFSTFVTLSITLENSSSACLREFAEVPLACSTLELLALVGGFEDSLLAGGEGVMGSSPSSMGGIGGVLSTPLMQSAADRDKSSGSSGLLKERPRSGAGLSISLLPLPDNRLLLGDGELIPLLFELARDPGPTPVNGGTFPPALLLAAIEDGGDLVQRGVFSPLSGSVLIETLSKESWCPLRATWAAECPFCIGWPVSPPKQWP